jgi:hypothetical protein
MLVPGIAVDEDAVYITNNMYAADGSGFTNSLLWIIEKSPFYNGGIVSFKRYDYITLAGQGRRGTHMPAMVRDLNGIAPSVGTYLVSYGRITDGTNEYVQIIQITNPLSSNPTFTQYLVNVGNIEIREDLPPAPQPRISNLIDTGDRRALDAVWVNNQLWMVTTITLNDQASAYWFKFNADGIIAPTLAGY